MDSPRNDSSFFTCLFIPGVVKDVLLCRAYKQECKQSNFLLASCYLAKIVVHEIDVFFVLC